MQHEVSVIIPTFNRSALLQDALKSVLGQTFQDFEVIVVDNSSKDNTGEVVRSFHDPRIKLFEIDNEGVIARSRNYGLKEAKGEFIAFLDDDDMWLPEKLEAQLNYLKEHPEYSAVYSNTWIVADNDSKRRLYLKPEGFRKGDIFSDLLKENIIPQLTLLIRREVFERVGLLNEDPSLRCVEDYEYMLRVAMVFKVGFIEAPLTIYRLHPGGAGSKQNFAKLKQRALLSVMDSPWSRDKEKIMKRVYELYLNSAYYNLKFHNFGEAARDLVKYLRYVLGRYRSGGELRKPSGI